MLLVSVIDGRRNLKHIVCRGRFADVPRLNIYASFQLKLNKCCHEVMINNVRNCVMLLEKVMISRKKKVITFLAVICNAIRDQYK